MQTYAKSFQVMVQLPPLTHGSDRQLSSDTTPCNTSPLRLTSPSGSGSCSVGGTSTRGKISTIRVIFPLLICWEKEKSNH